MPILDKAVTVSRPVSISYQAYQCDGCGLLNDYSAERRAEVEAYLSRGEVMVAPYKTTGIDLTGWTFLSTAPVVKGVGYTPMPSKVFCPDCTKKVHV